ncbi:MAG TPA: bacillithiol system redox-active protein YtxJ [Sphingobacteriaceae bacterium]|nr:bacillithiol system redox-active protein YtxJ [Sphingobacteriaceae bacterium]
MNWIMLQSFEQLSAIKAAKGYSIIFKHSTRCSISMMMKKRVEMDWDILPENVNVYFLDLISYRNISNGIVDIFQIHHESPQLLVIRDGECIYESSHGEISIEEAAEQILSSTDTANS